MIVSSRLLDPDNVAGSPERFKKLSRKLAATLSMLSLGPKNGGNPFLFCIAASKPHILCVKHGHQKIPTAATNGKSFFWNPDFLEKLTPYEVPIVVSHEVYHWICHHVQRGRGFKFRIWQMAIDYIANALVENDHVQNKRGRDLWGGNLGEPWLLADLLAWVDGDDNRNMKSDGYNIYADYSCLKRAPEDIYDEILQHWKDSPRKCPDCAALSLDPVTSESRIEKPWAANSCKTCGAKSQGGGGGDGLGSTLDSHLESETTDQEVMTEIMRAASQAKQMRGDLPSIIEELLGKLTTPQLSFYDLIRSMCIRKSMQAGLKNNWKRPRRRSLSLDMYVPSRHNYKPKWIALIDTSGSMSDNAIAHCISQLGALGGETDGLVVPCDAKVHWDSAVKINSVRDLQSVKVIGRGGTVFNEFFEEFPKRCGNDFDVCIVLTDGWVGSIPIDLKPSMPVVWVICGNTNFRPTFGRVVPLYGNI